jgi:glucokinase
MGEMTYGVAKGMKNFIMITLGTGVGSGIVINGQVVYGCDGFAGELGHVIMDRSSKGRLCGCGRKGCLEAYCSATGVARSARDLLETTDRPSLLREMKAEEITSLDVAIAAGKGDELAKEVFDFTGKMLGEACADFAAFSSPEAFVFFGGLTKAGELIMKPIEEAYNRQVLPIFKGKAKLLVSTLDGAGAAVLGASALGWEA